MFIDVVVNTSYKITQNWVIDLNDGIKHLAFCIIGLFCMVHYVDSITNMHFAITREGFYQAIKNVKAQCTTMCDVLVLELERMFPNHELMNVFGIFYLQY
jgi:hypothetical protein